MEDLVTLASVIGSSVFGTKLLSTVSNGIGKIWEPIHVRRMAAAERDAIVSQAKSNAEIALVQAQSDAAIQELAVRTGERMFKLELRRQANSESILGKAARENPAKVSAQPVNEDWTINFFDSCKDIGDEEMQKLWGKILAGEVALPGSFSHRTVQSLKMLTKQEADLFASLCCFCWRRGNVPMAVYWRVHEEFIYSDVLSEDDLLHLGSIGLITEGLHEHYESFPAKNGLHLSYFDRRFFLETVTDRPNAGATMVATTKPDTSAVSVGTHISL